MTRKRHEDPVAPSITICVPHSQSASYSTIFETSHAEADALQIRSLFLRCVEGINEILSVPTAPRILSDSFSILGGPLAEQISKAATDVIAEHFDEYCTEELQRLPPSTLAQILRRDDISVMHENEIFDFVADAAQSLTFSGRAAEATQLWQSIRFGALSNSYMVRAAQVETIPRMTLIWSKVLNRNGNQALEKLMNEQCLSEGWPIPAAPNPRKPFKDMTCAVMYSVDTDARNDQDVERNITAATLVAEEIEFLGGRAILENIFARQPPLRECAEGTIINMEQIDVAFVLAPWTPSDKRIARLINFVDQGGGAVLLSFIGGLSKGVWRDLEYEPLITGKSLDGLGRPSSGSVRELKSRLAKVAGCGPRFRQRLLCGSRELCDDEELSGPAELQLVVLPPRPTGPGDGLGLLDAIIEGNAARVEALLRDCHSPSAILYAASARGHLQMVQLLLEAGADKDGDDGSVQPPLQAACRWGKLEVARFLVSVGADKDRLAITFTAMYGSTPLMEASRRGHVDVVKFLLEARADKERRNTRGETALHWASSAGRSETVSLLLEAGADVHQTTAAGSTPLLEAWRLGHLDAACRLRCAGADLGRVPLFQVADNTPYEDVFLSSSNFSCLDRGSSKRSQDTITPPRILCGVDSINGRRRITSTLVEGAKATGFLVIFCGYRRQRNFASRCPCPLIP
ncbi:Ankrd17 [Symbiodinium sp. CCMP2592]|nr:Ankrd17 [Symbiodinium sp. CCMP2592]